MDRKTPIFQSINKLLKYPFFPFDIYLEWFHFSSNLHKIHSLNDETIEVIIYEYPSIHFHPHIVLQKPTYQGSHDNFDLNTCKIQLGKLILN